jgi:hypothetical protein
LHNCKLRVSDHFKVFSLTQLGLKLCMSFLDERDESFQDKVVSPHVW